MRQRELEVAREIAHAFLNASRPIEVYRLALVRVTPLMQASFSSVFLRDASDPTLLRLECAQNWPQSSARFLSQLRIRVGRGPTGRTVAEGVPIEVQDLFADPSLREWWEPARELGFSSLIALPIRARGEVCGALSFYFDAPHEFDEDERRLLSLVADQLAATVEKAELIADLQEANATLRKQNSELGESVREATEAQRLKNEFLANVSHELRTPLTSILGYTYLLANGQVPDPQEALSKIERSATALLGLIDDLIELSQLKLGRSETSFGQEQAIELARRAMEACGPIPAGITLDLSAPDGPVPLVTDGEKVVKILTNLLSNALKFTAAGTVTTTVSLGDRGSGDTASHVEWHVRDTGVGIRREELEAIFDEFRQVDGSSTRLYGGTGLGLALSLRLARLLGGDLSVSSEPGRGSTFTLRLPLAPAAAKAE
jgi:signal transduction histidine kinase